MVVSIYTGILALMFIFLAFKIILLRVKYRQRVGDGDHADLRQYIRAHANFAEYVPFALLMLALLEIQKTSIITLHILGIALVIARIAHAYGLMTKETYENDAFTGSITFRQIGMVLTFTVYIMSAILLLLIGLERY